MRVPRAKDTTKLGSYRAKRDFETTSEPAGEARGDADGRRFVIQEHHATRLHWDLRLEHDGRAGLVGGSQRHPARPIG